MRQKVRRMSMSHCWRKVSMAFSVTMLFALITGATFAQKTITGKVVDDQGNPVFSANVVEKGTTNGTTTGMDGTFSLEVSEEAKALKFSFVGFKTKTVQLKGRTELNVTMSSSVELDEVVVTALGVEREEKALGYSVSKIDAKQVSEVKTNNVTDQLAGKAAGVYVTSGQSGPTASANINIRGAVSLTGNNQPLFVVNGMPITNDLYSFDDGLNGSTTIDFGNAAQIVNPDDIKSMNVLKGPAASALYGSRAADGVILIETKTGENQEGWGIEINNSLTFQEILKLPNYQNQYGFGGGGKYSYKDGSNYIGGNDYYEAYGENWGPAMNGQDIVQFDSDGNPAPFTPAEDNVRNFFRTGVTNIANVAINKNSEEGDFRLSYTNLENQGIIPNTDLTRHTFQTSMGRNFFDDKLRVRYNSMIINSQSGNIPNAGYDESSSIMYGWLWYPRQVEIDDLRDYWQPGQEGVQQRYVENSWVNNPWFVANENTNSFQNNRIIGNLKVNYDIAENLSARVRFGADVLDEQRQFRRAPSTKGTPNEAGSYREDEISFYETNLEGLLSYNLIEDLKKKGFINQNKVGSDFRVNLKVGGNLMNQNSNISVSDNPELKLAGTSPSVYSLTNNASPVQTESQLRRRSINSVFGLASFSYKYFLYLDASFRNDWNSTLANPITGLENSDYSFGYPSVSLSAVLSEVIDLKSTPINFLKVRANYAEVGNGAPAYAFGRTFTPRASYGNQSLFTTQRTITDRDLTNERTSAYEAGLDVRLFDGRLRFDATYYDMRSSNQVITLPTTTSSGYDFTLTNGGEISNKGVELMISGTPIQKKDFRWDVTLNAGHNRAIVEKLPDVIESGRYSIVSDMYPGDEGGADLEYVAEEGEPLGQLYGLGFERDPETDEIIHYGEGEKAGLPILTQNKVSAGSYQPDLRLGLYNSFTYKDFTLSFLIDGQIGGNIYSRSHALYNTGGTITNEDDPNLDLKTTEGRTVYSVSYDGTRDADGDLIPTYTLEQEGGVVGPGKKWVDENGDGEINHSTELQENDVEVEPGGAGYTGYFYNYYGNGFNRDNIEAATYDATYFKLREVSISYRLPKDLASKIGAKSARVSLIGRNLLLWTRVPSIDPETYSVRNGIFVNGFESTQLPSTRSIGLMLNLKF
ncbi:SusC/RagA family TonB-linked outer membrane protein [Salibacter sp.]|uniref:SusC/RagA family TonB-linked outer membrane protein n=1 Tax=Salibacter sp. TaxID=2010995 RepID=UPI0028706724|nr:SusC/RagA family TonB-linked outer membrane protein [Salibacter sp.]MDR9397839.1 SusC/RagA family TonB-linked outer membrane protein [Salibacter sp.]MDR9486639.1 SusC/RagA family TonB-linked outer membrane protein [Salibacter sp.]